jgi:hypothetical protein
MHSRLQMGRFSSNAFELNHGKAVPQGLNRLRKNSESHHKPLLLDGCPMFAPAYMGRK